METTEPPRLQLTRLVPTMQSLVIFLKDMEVKAFALDARAIVETNK
jgi:hypothetical protein